MKTYISLTVLPSRLNSIEKCIESLVNQTVPADKILVWLPKVCKRTGHKIGDIPKFLKHSNIEINYIEDVGSISKIYYAIKRYKNIKEQCNIISVDDDVKYPANFIKQMLKFEKKKPNSVLCYRGRPMNFNKIDYNNSKLFRANEINEIKKIDIVTGTWGVLYKPSFFDDKFFNFTNKGHLHVTDDIWISAHLAANNINCYVIPLNEQFKPLPQHSIDSLWQLNKNGQNNNKAIKELKHLFMKNKKQIPDKYKNVGTKSKIKVLNQNITLNHHIDHIGRAITISKKFYEQEMLDYIYKNIPRRGTYIDAGANIGNHTVFFAKYCADNVIAIEPVKENVDILKRNIKNNSIENCQIVDKGISSDGRNFGVKKVEYNMGSCTLTENGEEIQTIKVEDLNINEVALIKIDCEDMSLEVLNSFMPIIKKYKPHLFIEATNEELRNIIKITGYKKMGKFNATPTYHLKPVK